MTDKILLGTTRYEISIKRDATSQGVHSLVMRPMNEPSLTSVAFEMPSMGEPGKPMKLDQKMVIDLPTYLKAST